MCFVKYGVDVDACKYSQRERFNMRFTNISNWTLFIKWISNVDNLYIDDSVGLFTKDLQHNA